MNPPLSAQLRLDSDVRLKLSRDSSSSTNKVYEANNRLRGYFESLRRRAILSPITAMMRSIATPRFVIRMTRFLSSAITIQRRPRTASGGFGRWKIRLPALLARRPNRGRSLMLTMRWDGSRSRPKASPPEQPRIGLLIPSNGRTIWLAMS